MFKIGNIFSLPPDDIASHPKFAIVVGGNSDCVALVYINTDISQSDITEEIQSLSHPITQDEFGWLKYTSFVDCSDLIKKNKRELNKLLQKDPQRIYRELPAECIQKIMNIITRSKSITSYEREEYGIKPIGN